MLKKEILVPVTYGLYNVCIKTKVYESHEKDISWNCSSNTIWKITTSELKEKLAHLKK